MAAPRQARSGNDGIPPLEWAAALMGFMLVSGALIVLIWLGWTRGTAPADVTIRVEGISRVASGYLVTIRGVNRGATAAADVAVEGELRGPSGVIETASMSFKYLAPNAERSGGLFFEKDPRAFELKVRPKGFETP